MAELNVAELQRILKLKKQKAEDRLNSYATDYRDQPYDKAIVDISVAILSAISPK